MSDDKYSVKSPGFLDLPGSKRANAQDSKPASELESKRANAQKGKVVNESGKPVSEPGRVTRKRKQLSLKGFDADLHRRFSVASQKEDRTMVSLAEDVISEWLDKKGH